jgi:AcrR family transcriptional regulator
MSARALARKRPLQERAQVTVESLVVAAERVLQREGVARLTTNRIAEVAGVSVGSVYQYFPGKQAIVAALAERYILRYADAFETLLAVAGGQSIERVIEAVLRGLNVMRKQEGATVHRALHEQMTSAALSVCDERVHARYTATLDRYLLAHPEAFPKRTPLTAYVIVHAASGVMRAWAMGEHAVVDDEALISDAVRLLVPFLTAT